MKLPKCYKFNPKFNLIFNKIVEPHRVAKIKTHATKVDHVVLALDPEVAAEIDDFLWNPPEENQYDRLCDILRRKGNHITWSDEAERALKLSKNLLARSTLLVHPTQTNTRIVVDASDVAVGAVKTSYSQNLTYKTILIYSNIN